MNILYIVTDGIETCRGSAVEVAERLKNENTNIVLGIIGFNVDANQNKILSDIAAAGGGYYANANDAAKLTAELQRIHELAFSDYNWEELTENVYEDKLRSFHASGLAANDISVVFMEAETENNTLLNLIGYGADKNSSWYAGLYKDQGKVEQRLREMANEREDKIRAILKEEFEKRKAESEQYLESVKSRIGSMVVIVPSTSRLDEHSKYWVGQTDYSGNLEDMNKDTESLEADLTEETKESGETVSAQ